QSRFMFPGEYPVGPNLGVRASALQDIEQPWFEGIGPGTHLPVGDEIFFSTNVTTVNTRDKYYLATAEVRHIPGSYNTGFLQCLKRTFRGGLAAGLHKRHIAAQPDSLSPGSNTPLHTLVSIRSLREFLCVVSRFCGHLVSPFIDLKDFPGTTEIRDS
ncbi:MAG: hypothetical protein MI673_03495, partial [Thiotrichales bacterium]|nr:hypothetical protein [Thiotrichales bacterium]